MIVRERHRVKAYGYIVRDKRLLVFREPDYPDAGVQVPGGTVEPGEEVGQGLARELREETGRGDFSVLSKLATHPYSYEKDGTRHVHERHFFHVATTGNWPDTWMHSDATPDLGGPPVRFVFHWADLNDPTLLLAAELGSALGRLRTAVGA
jgi:8-oxo-dGTP pyrophosphatase MutT (NUDIX family)